MTTRPHVTTEGWHTVCLDRFLLDLPGVTEAAAANAGYRGGIVFPGVQPTTFTVGLDGVRWVGIRIDESHATDAKGYSLTYAASGGIVSDAVNGDRSVLESNPRELKHYEKLLASGTPKEKTYANEVLAEGRHSIDEHRKGLANSGEATVPRPFSFAYRANDEFVVGYLDPTDHRTRSFGGKLQHPEVQGPASAAAELQRFQRIYRRRLPSEIPATPGVCTGHGFIEETGQSEADIEFDLPFRSSKYPNLIFSLTVDSADVGMDKDIQKMPDMGLDESALGYDGSSNSYGPKRVSILGAPGRIAGAIYPSRCVNLDDCDPPSAAYEIDAKTYGLTGRLDVPRVRLHMAAAMPDDYKLKRDPKAVDNPNDEDAVKLYTVPRRPGLTGHQPPPFKEGLAIFEAVLKSLRVRPNGIAGSNTVMTVSPALSSASASRR